MTKREAEERRLEQRAQKIGRLETFPGQTVPWFACIHLPNDDTIYGDGRTHLAALRDLLRRCDRFADKVVASREGE